MPRKRHGPDMLRSARLHASMRPGHCAPEKADALGERGRPDLGASMRPGHCAPEKGGRRGRYKVLWPCFNEAGALCPGKGAPQVARPQVGPARFNEAGALCPGKGRKPHGFCVSLDRFNEAGALCPGKGRYRVGCRAGRFRASMRPGHCAPEKGEPRPTVVLQLVVASMRPGHCAPEKGPTPRSSPPSRNRLQ